MTRTNCPDGYITCAVHNGPMGRLPDEDKASIAARIAADEERKAAVPTCTDPTHDHSSSSCLGPVSSDLDGATESPAEAVQLVTPGEFAARWNSWSEERRAGFLRAMQNSQDQAERCRRLHTPERIGSGKL